MIFSNYIIYAGLLAFLIAILLTPFVIKIATLKNFVVKPRADRWHTKPTALLGGIAIYFAFILPILIFGYSSINWVFIFTTLVMFSTGLVDDIKEVKPIIKLLGQITCSFAIIYEGFVFGGSFSWLGIPITFLWVIGITNAINLLDNMDGLSAGITAIISFILGIMFVQNNETFLAIVSFSLSGATLGFLVYNFNPAKIFMGDCGSLFIGYSVAFLSLGLQKSVHSGSSLLILVIPIGLMAIPIMDTTLVTIRRIISGRSIHQGGKDHTSHRLVALGLTERNAVLTLYIISIVWGIICLFLEKLDVFKYPLLLLMSLFSIIFISVLSTTKVYNESEEQKAYLRSRGYGRFDSLFLRFFLMNKKILLGIIVDISIICSSFFISSYLSTTVLSSDNYLLALFVLIKIFIFYYFNLYNRLWRFISTFEILNNLLCVLFSTSILFFIYKILNPAINLSVSFFIIDFFITFSGILFVRITYRALQDFFKLSGQVSKKVVIYGAGNGGYFLLKEIYNNKNLDYKIVGFIDDDRIKHNMYINGIKIFGSVSVLKNLIKKHHIDIVIVSTNHISEDNCSTLNEITSSMSVEVLSFSVKLSPYNTN